MNRQILKNIIFSGLFIVPFIPFLVSGSLFFPFITTKAYAWRIIIEVVFAAWVLLAALEPGYRPRKSWTTYALLVFVAVIGLADLFGAAPVKSFWSNSERMEGYVSLLHLLMYYLVVRSVFTLETWKRWWGTSLAASFLMCIYCFFQLLGVLEIHQGGARVDGTLGNAAYLAVYMLIHVFIALFYLMRTRGSYRWLYGLIAVLDTVVLYYTATRGAILGLLGGLLVAAVLSFSDRENSRVRKLAISYVAIFAAIVLGFFALRGTSFVQGSPVLSRFASISRSEVVTEGRAFVWPMAVKGALKRPILGYGQDNFNYIFNTYYSPEMYRIEPWFDRAHNIFLDWATQGGILGLLAYLALYYVLLRALFKSTAFSRGEKAIITGLVAAYFFHNIFVFDHLISYILFISLLAFVDAGTESSVVLREKIYSEDGVRNMGMPLTLVLVVLTLYFVNIRPILANMSLISALRDEQSGNATAAVSDFERAYGTARLGRPEVVEQLASNAPQILSSNLSMDEKNAFYAFAKSAVLSQAAELPTDARYQLLAGTFLENTGQFDESMQYLEKARELTPGKQMVYYEEATVAISRGDNATGLKLLKEAYDLAPQNTDAEVAYLVGAIYAGDRATEASLRADLGSKSPSSLSDDRIASAYASTGRVSEAAAMFSDKIAHDPNDTQNYLNLAALYLKAGDKQDAIATLQKLGAALPQYKATADGYIEQIKNGTLK